jgi:hypothetical protein
LGALDHFGDAADWSTPAGTYAAVRSMPWHCWAPPLVLGLFLVLRFHLVYVHRRTFDMRGQNLSGKTCVVTGGNKGIGFATAASLAGAGCHVILACRSEQRGKEAIEKIKKTHPAAKPGFVQCDLSSLQSVADACDALRDVKIDFLVNNAGGHLSNAVTDDGLDLQYATNHLGHFLLTRKLVDNGNFNQRARIVNVSRYVPISSGCACHVCVICVRIVGVPCVCVFPSSSSRSALQFDAQGRQRARLLALQGQDRDALACE